MITGEHEKKLRELQYALKCKGVLKSKEEVFEMLIEFFKENYREN